MSDARILERGYRRYDGPRLGHAHAVRSVIAHTLRRILGLRRPARTKVLPVMSIAFAYLPAIVFVGVIAVLGRFGAKTQARTFVPRYSEYYGFIVSALVLFVAFVAPEALCPDRRSRVLSLYLASPLTRMTYLLSKAAAVFIVLLAVTVGPPLLLLLGLMSQSAGPDGPVAVLQVLLQILAAGVFLATLFTALSMGVASLTDRRAVAAAATVFLVIGAGVVAGTLVFALHGSEGFVVIAIVRSALELVRHIFGDRGELRGVGTPALIVGNLAWTLATAAIAVVRYRRLQVTR
ncbi:MAG: type transport system permease protein [Actinomycetota bacterium]|jgi:ABC-2 type transport system permease protein|nr:type transport system permease protein [Actinomycetota bacterium]